MQEFVFYMKKQQKIMNSETYQSLWSEAEIIMNDFFNMIDEEYQLFHSFFTENADWNIFKKSAEYADNWHSIWNQVKNAEHNAKMIQRIITMIH